MHLLLLYVTRSTCLAIYPSPFFQSIIHAKHISKHYMKNNIDIISITLCNKRDIRQTQMLILRHFTTKKNPASAASWKNCCRNSKPKVDVSRDATLSMPCVHNRKPSIIPVRVVQILEDRFTICVRKVLWLTS